MVRYYDAVDIVVIPSLSEGLPNVLLEALEYKKIVVSTPVGAVPTILANGETGYLAQSADVEALTAALQRCLEDTGSHSTLREQGYELIEKRFSAKTRAARVVELYRTILSRVYS